MTTLLKCPACGTTEQSPFIECLDYTVSHETFSIVTCTQCQFAFTNPRPELSKLGDYYLSTDYVSHSAQPASFMDRVYVLARTQTLKWKTALVKKHAHANAKTLLDYGCGTGDFMHASNQKGWNVKGVEPSPIARQIAAEKTGLNISSTIEEVGPVTFDIITLWHVLEHVPDLNGLVSELKNKLTQTGTIFIAVPNRSSWDAAYYRDKWAAYDVPRHLWHFRQKDIQKIVSAHSLTVVQTLPMKLDAYYVSLLSEKYRHNTLNPITVFKSMINGIRSNLSAKSTSEYSSLIYVIKK